MTTQTLLENLTLDSFTPILKERSGKKNYLGVFTYPISFILKYENGGLPKAKILCPRTVWACSYGAQVESFEPKN